MREYDRPGRTRRLRIRALALTAAVAACVRAPLPPPAPLPCALPPGASEAASDAALRAAVVLIRATTAGGGVRTGVGFAVADGSRLLTAAHVVAGAVRITVRGACGAAATTVAARAPGGDVAVLHAPWRLPALTPALSLPAGGTAVVLLGDAGGLGRVEFSDGVWRNEPDGHGAIATWAAPGSSGSPVLIRGTDVVAGMVVAGAAAPAPRTLVLPSTRFAPWLRVHFGADP